MSERPFKVEQWSKDFAGITKVILQASNCVACGCGKGGYRCRK
jgi:hypothetical protein